MKDNYTQLITDMAYYISEDNSSKAVDFMERACAINQKQLTDWQEQNEARLKDPVEPTLEEKWREKKREGESDEEFNERMELKHL